MGVMEWKFGERQGHIYGRAAACAVGVSPLPKYQRKGEGGDWDNFNFAGGRSRSERENMGGNVDFSMSYLLSIMRHQEVASSKGWRLEI